MRASRKGIVLTQEQARTAYAILSRSVDLEYPGTSKPAWVTRRIDAWHALGRQLNIHGAADE